jgi:hypothetical protein
MINTIMIIKLVDKLENIWGGGEGSIYFLSNDMKEPYSTLWGLGCYKD